MPQEALPCYVGGRTEHFPATLAVEDKFLRSVAAHVAVPDRESVDRAIACAVKAVPAMRRLPAYRRREALGHIVEQLSRRAEEFALTLVVETGKTIAEARTEVSRSIATFTLSMEEATRLGGEVLPLDVSPRTEGLRGMWKRVPVGPCSFITPFNFPLNLAAHKIGPAMAAGCPFVLKPDPRTPLTSLMLGDVLSTAGLPEGCFSILPIVRDGLEMLSEDERLRFLSFTGSTRVGWMLKARAGRKRVALELGGNAACIVDEGVDVSRAADRLAAGAFALAGQSCISVQRIFVWRDLHDAMIDAMTTRIGAMTLGDPRLPSTTMGPMISEDEARRIEAWIGEAVDAGGRIVVGGEREGQFVHPALLTHVPRTTKLWREEVFGPVAIVEPFDVFTEALEAVNDAIYGLQAGVFTPRLDHAMLAFDELEVGGIIINDVPTLRVDAMPYGGVKASGLGREGVRFAIEDMTEIRMLAMRDPG